MSDDAEQSDTRRLPTLDKAPDASAEGTGAAPDATATGTVDDGRTGRFWSARRVPAGVVALLLLAAAGLLLYDVVAVRADHPAMAWRRWLARELATLHLDNPWVLAAAALAVVLGIWLIVLAVTPDCAGCCRCDGPRRTSGPGWTGRPPRWCCATAPWRSPVSSPYG